MLLVDSSITKGERIRPTLHKDLHEFTCVRRAKVAKYSSQRKMLQTNVIRKHVRGIPIDIHILSSDSHIISRCNFTARVDDRVMGAGLI